LIYSAFIEIGGKEELRWSYVIRLEAEDKEY
jgi:hypothetical protein